MANYANLLAQIDANIYQNDSQAITGSVMNTQLKAMVDALGAGYQFMGVATPTTDPGTPDQKVFYLAVIPGVYGDFDNSEIQDQQIGVFYFDSSWHSDIRTLSVTDVRIPTDPNPFSIDGKYLSATGGLVNNSAYHCTELFAVSPGDEVVIDSFCGSPICALCAYNSNSVFVSTILTSGTFEGERIIVPDGVAFLRACGKKLVEGNTIDASAVVYVEKYATPAQVSAMASAIAQHAAEEVVDDALSSHESLVFSVDNKYISQTGVYTSNNSYHCTDYVSVNQGDKIVLTAYNGSPIPSMVGYDANKGFVEILLGTGTHQGAAVEIPEGISFVVCCGKKLVEGNTIDASGTVYAVKYVTRDEWENREQESADYIVFRKTSSTEFFIDYHLGAKVLSYKFTRYEKTFQNITYIDEHGETQIAPSVKASEMWNNSGLYLDETYIAEGNTNFISSYVGYVGDGHGCEVMRYASLCMDGKEINFNTIDTIIKGKVFQFVIKSDMYLRDQEQSTSTELNGNVPKLDTSGNPIVMSQHNMVIRISRDGLFVDNTQRILMDGVEFRECHGAMLEVNYGLFNRVWVNNDENTINEVGVSTFTPISGSSVNLQNNYVHGNKVIMYGGDFAITQEMEVMLPMAMNPGIYFNDYTNSRLKAYFQPVPTSTRSGGQTARVFNTGDVIRVRNKRTIDF